LNLSGRNRLVSYDWVRKHDPVGAVLQAMSGEWNWTVSQMFELRAELNRKCEAVKREMEKQELHPEDIGEEDLRKWTR
jgi:hypothetical protein